MDAKTDLLADDLIDEVVQLGLDRAKCRRVPPAVLKALMDLEWTETMLAEYLEVSVALVSHWITGRCRMKAKYWPALLNLLEDMIDAYEFEIDRLREQGQWGESAAYYMRYRLSYAKGVLTRYRNRGKVKLKVA